MEAGAFAGENKLRASRRQPEQIAVDQRVINHHIGPRQQLRPAQCHQTGVTRPCAHQINHPFAFHAGQSMRPRSLPQFIVCFMRGAVHGQAVSVNSIL